MRTIKFTKFGKAAIVGSFGLFLGKMMWNAWDKEVERSVHNKHRAEAELEFFGIHKEIGRASCRERVSSPV